MFRRKAAGSIVNVADLRPN